MLFSSREEYQSSKNGTIIVEKFLWYTSIIVNNCLEAGTYLIDMWKDALKKLPKKFTPKNVLLLGLGGGNVIRLLQDRYPGVHVTVVEWDDVMIKIAKKLQLFSIDSNLKISNKDAYDSLENMSEKFDLVIVDLFTGPVPPEFLGDEKTVFNLKKVLKKDGYIFLNVYKHVKYILNFQSHFTTEKIWKFRLNNLAIFRHASDGTVKDNVPEGFTDMRQSENFLKGLFKFGITLKHGGVLGVRHIKGLFAVEYYTSDEEPVILPFKGFRFIIWDRVTSDLIPKGWHQMIPGFGLGTSVVSDLKDDEYWKIWSETARRYRLKWERQTEYEIVNLGLDTFTSYYLKFGRPEDTRVRIMQSLENRVKINKESIKLFALRHKETGKIFGGMATVDAEEISQSYYLYSFLNKEEAPAQAGHWLINNWLSYCKGKGIRFANFGPVWTRGEPKSWKGFTEFKAHFRPFTLSYKNPLFKFTFSLKDL